MGSNAVPLSIISYNYTDWTLTVAYPGGKRYTYTDVPSLWYTRIQTWLDHKNYGAAIRFLQRLARQNNPVRETAP